MHFQFVGPKLWRKKMSRDMKKTLILYNTLQIAINGWFIYNLYEFKLLNHHRPEFCESAELLETSATDVERVSNLN